MGATLNGSFPRCQYTSIFSLMNFSCVINDLHISALVHLGKKMCTEPRGSTLCHSYVWLYTHAPVGPVHEYIYTRGAHIHAFFSILYMTTYTCTIIILIFVISNNHSVTVIFILICCILSSNQSYQQWSLIMFYFLFSSLGRREKVKFSNPRMLREGTQPPNNTRSANMTRCKYPNTISSTRACFYIGCTATLLTLGTQGVIIILMYFLDGMFMNHVWNLFGNTRR